MSHASPSSRLASFALFCALTLTGAAQSQSNTAPPAEKGDVTTLSVKVKVVNVLATVRDKHGKIVNYLTKDDFLLSEDGQPQTIRYFAKESDLPLTLGLLVDTSLSQRKVLDQERMASSAFLDKIMRPQHDKAFLIHFDREVELLQDLTSSLDDLHTGLGKLETPQYRPASSGDPSGPGGPDPGQYPGRGQGGMHRGGGTTLYDAVYLAAEELMQKQEGRKAVIVLSDGVDRGSKESLDSAVESAQKADTLVYAIYFKGEEGGNSRVGFGIPGMGGPGMGGPGRRGGGRPGGPAREPHIDGKKILQKIAQATGGRFFEVSKKETVDQIYTQIEEELRNQYNLGYTPQRAGADSGMYHKIQLTTKNRDLAVQAREGYYSEE
ncbi:MAG: VWA domain-containing protein [Acidobacteria bacterium]|nr:VWA domain-containing protein [Acidobacteriota bacterium]